MKQIINANNIIKEFGSYAASKPYKPVPISHMVNDRFRVLALPKHKGVITFKPSCRYIAVLDGSPESYIIMKISLKTLRTIYNKGSNG